MESTADTGLSRKLAQYLEKLPEPALLKLAYGLEWELLRAPGTPGEQGRKRRVRATWNSATDVDVCRS